MSTFIWGKIKFNKKIIIDNYQRNNILVFFSNQKNDFFVVSMYKMFPLCWSNEHGSSYFSSAMVQKDAHKRTINF